MHVCAVQLTPPEHGFADPWQSTLQLVFAQDTRPLQAPKPVQQSALVTAADVTFPAHGYHGPMHFVVQLCSALHVTSPAHAP